MGDQPSTCCPVYTRYLTPTQIESIRLVNGVIRGDTNLVKSALEQGANVNTRLDLNLISMGDNALSAKPKIYRSPPPPAEHHFHSQKTIYHTTTNDHRTQFGSPWMYDLHQGDHDDHSSNSPGRNRAMNAERARMRPPTSPETSTSHHRLTPLMRAMSQGDEEIVNILIEHGANMDEKDDYGMCALTMAVVDGQIDLVEKIWDRFSETSKMNLQDYCDACSTYACSKGEDPDVSPEVMTRVTSLLKNEPEWPEELIIFDY